VQVLYRGFMHIKYSDTPAFMMTWQGDYKERGRRQFHLDEIVYFQDYETCWILHWGL